MDLFLKAGLAVPLTLAIPAGKDLADLLKGGKDGMMGMFDWFGKRTKDAISWSLRGLAYDGKQR